MLEKSSVVHSSTSDSRPKLKSKSDPIESKSNDGVVMDSVKLVSRFKVGIVTISSENVWRISSISVVFTIVSVSEIRIFDTCKDLNSRSRQKLDNEWKINYFFTSLGKPLKKWKKNFTHCANYGGGSANFGVCTSKKWLFLANWS